MKGMTLPLVFIGKDKNGNIITEEFARDAIRKSLPDIPLFLSCNESKVRIGTVTGLRYGGGVIFGEAKFYAETSFVAPTKKGVFVIRPIMKILSSRRSIEGNKIIDGKLSFFALVRSEDDADRELSISCRGGGNLRDGDTVLAAGGKKGVVLSRSWGIASCMALEHPYTIFDAEEGKLWRQVDAKDARE